VILGEAIPEEAIPAAVLPEEEEEEEAGRSALWPRRLIQRQPSLRRWRSSRGVSYFGSGGLLS